jgi:hypothetical protein
MKRHTLDIMFSVGGVAIAALLVVFGFVLKAQGDFARVYVGDQLASQEIYFTPAENLSEEEATSTCLVQYGTGDETARLMVTGKQAECYANEFIGLHLRASTAGMSYAQLGTPQRELRAKVEEAKANSDPSLPDLETQLATVNSQRETAFRGETLRGLLLTVYGFSILGEKAALGATAAFAGAGVMLLLSIAGFIHAFRTSKSDANMAVH